jgi:hypothetical protein
MVWTDIDAEFEAEFNRWYDEEHISRLLEVPGFLSAGRYMAIRGGPKYLAMYELEDHNVLRSAAYLDTVKYQPSPQRVKIGTSRIGRNFLRNAYRQIFPVPTHPVRADGRDGAVSANGADRGFRRHRGGVQCLVQYGLHSWLSGGARMSRRPPVRCCRGSAEVPDRVRVRACQGVGKRCWGRARISNPRTRRVQPQLRHDEGSPGVYRRIYPK